MSDTTENIRYRLVCADGSHHLAIDQGCGPHRFEPMERDEQTPSLAHDLALRSTRSASFAKLYDDLVAENAQLRREAQTRAHPSEHRDNLLRSLAAAVRSDDLTRARTLAAQEATTR